jgi:hypothetical protein
VADGPAEAPMPERVGDLAHVYLGNILYALERCALALDQDGQPLEAAFYRGIGRKLADAHGRERSSSAS